MAVYDPNVFDITAFDAVFGIPSMLKVQVDPMHHKVMSGDIVTVTLWVVSLADPRRKFLFNPETPPAINVFYPRLSKTASFIPRVSNAAMTNLDTGIYQFKIQTGIVFDDLAVDSNVFDIVNNDPIGVYTGYFTARDGNISMRTRPQELYTVIEG